MARQHLEELTRSQTPQVNIVGVHGTGSDDISTLLDRQARELGRLVCLESAEVAILDEIECPHCAI